MPVTVTLPDDDTIQADELRDGQIGVITSWPVSSDDQTGIAVQRVGGDLLQIGHAIGGKSVNFFLDSNRCDHLGCRVRVMSNGSTLTVSDNE